MLLAIGLVAGCGYHLQRARDLPPVMQRTAVVASNQYSDLVRGLTRALSGTNIDVAPSTEKATSVLHIIRDRPGRRVVSVDNQDRPQAYELHYAVEFSVTHGGETILSPQTVSLTRTYVFNPDSVLAGNKEARQLLDSMRADLVQVILQRLAAVKATDDADDNASPKPLS